MRSILGCLATTFGLACAHAPATAPLAPASAAPRQRAGDLVYYVLLDRFADGDRWNNESFDLTDQQAFHGGDLRGVVEHIDHLADLGVGTLWLSPVFESRDEKLEGRGAYQGEWTSRLDALESRFGTLADVTALAQGARAHNMRVVLEVNYNSVDPQSPLVTEHPDWFHPDVPADATSSAAALQSGWYDGLADLDQDNPEAYAWLRDQTLRWLDAFGAHGVAVDGLRRLPPAFVRRLVADVRAVRPDTWFVGRAHSDDVATLAATVRDTGVDAVMDYPLRDALVGVFCEGAPVGRLASALALDRLYDDPEHQLVTFLDDGELPRITSECADHGHGPDDVHQALAVLLAARGTPEITYGTEFGLTGQVPPFNLADVSWAAEQPYGVTLREFTRQRSRSVALKEGKDWLFDLEDPNVFAMARVTADQAAVVLVNRSEEQVMVRLPQELSDGATMSTFHEVVDDRGPFLRHQMVANAPERAMPRVRPFFLAGRSTVVAYLEPATPGGFAPLVDQLTRWKQTTVPVVFEVDDGSIGFDVPGAKGLVVGPGDRAVVFGAGPELGGGSLDKALQLVQGPAGTWVTEPTAVPAWTALDWRIGVVRADGHVVTEQGPPRTTLVRPQGDGLPLAIRVSRHPRGEDASSPG